MPEGDTVYQTAHTLNRVLAGQVLTRSDIRVPRYATVDLSGRMIADVISRGKHLFMHVGDATIHSHLKMEGSWHVYKHGTRWKRPAYQARIVLETETDVAVGFDLGTLEVLDAEGEADESARLGPDLLGTDWDADEAVRRLLVRPDRMVSMALLDQHNLAGIGNIYMNELCYLRGVLPTRPVGEVDHPDKMVALAHRLLDANKLRPRTTTGRTRGDTTWVYGREGKPCLRCGTLIEDGMVGERGEHPRHGYWCPHCQK